MIDELLIFLLTVSKNYWKRIKPKKKLLIGLHWQGNKRYEKSVYSHRRSIGAEMMSKIGNIENAEYIALQKDKDRYDENILNNLEFVEGQDEFDKTKDFRDTCAVIDLCDYIISSDSSIVHLAGAMGKNIIILLNSIPEWRWGLGDEEIKWYKNSEVIRQELGGSWMCVINEAKRKILQ